MSQFCHDQYDHPLLWCDVKRRIVNQQDALLAMATVQESKEQDRQKRINEQREVYKYTELKFGYFCAILDIHHLFVLQWTLISL